MSTRSQKRRTANQEVAERVSSDSVAPVLIDVGEQNVLVVVPSRPEPSRLENNNLEKLRASREAQITLKMKMLLVKSQRELPKLLKPSNEERTTEHSESAHKHKREGLYSNSNYN